MKKTLPLMTLVRNIEEFVNQQYDYAALVHLKNQITKEVPKERKHYKCKITRNSPVAYEVIFSLRSQIETLQSEVHFLRNELKGKKSCVVNRGCKSKQNL